MDSRDNRTPGANRTDRQRPPPGSKPRLRAFLPYLILGLAILAIWLWMYVLGPAGDNDRGELLHLEDEPTTELRQPD